MSNTGTAHNQEKVEHLQRVAGAAAERSEVANTPESFLEEGTLG